jgi:glutamate/tyrosine decarboxylase-like PLP-dependent enzyme
MANHPAGEPPSAGDTKSGPNDRGAGPAPPFDLAREPLEAAAERAAGLFVSIARGLESRPVAPAATRAGLRTRFGGTLGEDGVGLMAVLDEFERLVLPDCMTTPHPLYLGLVNSSPLPGAALADLLISALNNNGGAFHQSPAMTACEEEVVRLFLDLFGFPAGSDGMILPGGTLANLQALVLARGRAFPDGELRRPRVYTSEAAHFSVARAACVAGIPEAGVVALPTRGRGEMVPEALAERIRRDCREGAIPVAVVATAGTTGTGAIDPLSAVADVCAREQVWFHVDACYGGAGILSEALRRRLGGIERADSIAVDPHKWFFIPVTAALLLTREREEARKAFATGAGSYIPGDGVLDAWQRGLPTTRRSSGLAVWMGLRAHGLAAVREAVERDVALMRLLEARLAAHGFRVLEGGELSICCARFEPAGRSDPAADALQERIASEVAASGAAWFGTVRHAGLTWLRFNLVNLHTREEHIERLAGLVNRTARAIVAG